MVSAVGAGPKHPIPPGVRSTLRKLPRPTTGNGPAVAPDKATIRVIPTLGKQRLSRRAGNANPALGRLSQTQAQCRLHYSFTTRSEFCRVVTVLPLRVS